ncbi:hypothetical protein Taro_045563 [Colocasia esculenta]|uniref:TPR1-like CTLH-containing domain-containing protein n=1 Tax=Colocasia esculenta TaxID=4460 RepID=A0A843X0H7_COLES|nr:hypothetical protein [Colocasia esculenta]
MSSLSRELVFLILQFLDEEKFKESVHKHDRTKAVEILVKDLKVFSTFNEELYKEITQLLTLENFRLVTSLYWCCLGNIVMTSLFFIPLSPCLLKRNCKYPFCFFVSKRKDH